MDKALLCPQCDRFSCICERTKNNNSSTNTNNATVSNTTSFSSSTSSSNTTLANNESNEANGKKSVEANEADATDNNNVLLRRSTSRSNTSLNFGTNIFKRFAERMSSNGNIFAATLRNSTNCNEISTDKT